MDRYFLVNQTVQPDPARQRYDEAWKVTTKTARIAIDSRARRWTTADYLDFEQDARNEPSAQGKWLDSYLFPNNFFVALNEQYHNVRRVRLVSTVFPATRSRTRLYIDDTNDHLFVRLAVAAPWITTRLHVAPNMTLIDPEYLSCTMAHKSGTVLPFYQEIPAAYGVPRAGVTDPLHESSTLRATMHGLTFLFSDLADGFVWGDTGKPNFDNTTVTKTGNDRELIAQTNVMKNAATAELYNVQVIFRAIDAWVPPELDADGSGDADGPPPPEPPEPRAVYQIVFQMNALAYAIQNPVLFIFGPAGADSEGIPQEVITTWWYPPRQPTGGPPDTQLNPTVTCTFDQRLFPDILRIEVHFERVVYPAPGSMEAAHTEPLVTLLMSTEKIHLGTATIDGTVTDMTALDDFRRVQGVFGGFVMFDKMAGEEVPDDAAGDDTAAGAAGGVANGVAGDSSDPLLPDFELPTGEVIPDDIRVGGIENVLTGTIHLEWDNRPAVDRGEGAPPPTVDEIGVLDGYVTSAIHDTGTGYYFQVTGTVTYESSVPLVYNNIRRYRDPATGALRYYGAYVQGRPTGVRNAALKEYIARALTDLTDEPWTGADIDDGVFVSPAAEARIDIVYGAYTIDELLTVLSRPVPLVSARLVGYRALAATRWYVVFVVAMTVPLTATGRYASGSFLVQFAVGGDPGPVGDSAGQAAEIEVKLEEAGIEFSLPANDGPVCGLYVVQTAPNMYGVWEIRTVHPLEPFVTVGSGASDGGTLPPPCNTEKAPLIPQYNYGVTAATVIDDVYYNMTAAKYFRASYVFPLLSTVVITPTAPAGGDIVIEHIAPPLPEGFKYDTTAIHGTSTATFSSFHFVYFRVTRRVVGGRTIVERFYQNVNLVNLPFAYTYRAVRLLVHTAFPHIDQTPLDAENLFGLLTASPFYKVTCDQAAADPVGPAGSAWDVAPGVTMSRMTGSVFGTPAVEFDVTLTVRAEFNVADFQDVLGGIKITLPTEDVAGVFEEGKYVTTLRLSAVSADKFYGDAAMMYSVFVDSDLQYQAWATPVEARLRDFVSFHILAQDRQSEKLLRDLHFSYSDSRALLTHSYLYGYYRPSLVSVPENTAQPGRYSFTQSAYTAAYRDDQIAQQNYLAQDPIYPLRVGLYGYATPATIALDTYRQTATTAASSAASSTALVPFVTSRIVATAGGTAGGVSVSVPGLTATTATTTAAAAATAASDFVFYPSPGTLWTALPLMVVNEVDDFLFGGPTVAQYRTSYDLSTGVPTAALPVATIDTVVDRIDPTATRYLDIIDVQEVLQDVPTAPTEAPVLYNRAQLVQDAVYAPTAVLDGYWNQLTINSDHHQQRPQSLTLGAFYNHVEPLVDNVLSEYDYYNFPDYVWLSVSVDNYGEFRNIFDVYTNRWYFAKIFFKRCENRYDTSYNYFECPPYETRDMNYIQELNALQVRIYDRDGQLFEDYRSLHFNFSFILEVEYFVDDIRANGVNTMRPDITG